MVEGIKMPNFSKVFSVKFLILGQNLTYLRVNLALQILILHFKILIFKNLKQPTPQRYPCCITLLT